MRLTDLRPDEDFPEPLPRVSEGPDAGLFEEHRHMVEALENECRCEAERMALGASGKKAASQAKALAACERAASDGAESARLTFMMTEAKTLEGVLLKLQCALGGQPMLNGGIVTDDVGFVCSAIDDLRRMIADADPRRHRTSAPRSSVAV